MEKRTAKDNVVQLQKLIARELLTGTELGKSFIKTDVYYEVKEELKKKAKVKFKGYLEDYWLDARDSLDLLDEIIVYKLPEYQIFYNKMLSTEEKIEMEKEIMLEIAEELWGREDYVIGFKKEVTEIINRKNINEDMLNRLKFVYYTEGEILVKANGEIINVLEEKMKRFAELIYSQFIKENKPTINKDIKEFDALVHLSNLEKEVIEEYKGLSEEERKNLFSWVINLDLIS